MQKKLKIDSPVFEDGEEIPTLYTQEGENVSPPIRLMNVPREAKEFVLICEDPDAVKIKPYVHWLIYNIPVSTNRIEADTVLYTFGRNSSDIAAYFGPKPPLGTGDHRYIFKLYALNKKMHLKSDLSKVEVLAKIKDHVIAEAEYLGKYHHH